MDDDSGMPAAQDDVVVGPTGGRISVGPFDREPADLGCLLSEDFQPVITGEEIRQRCSVWLCDQLDAAGVELGDADRSVVEVLAEDGWPVAQVVGGWVVRAGRRSGS